MAGNASSLNFNVNKLKGLNINELIGNNLNSLHCIQLSYGQSHLVSVQLNSNMYTAHTL